MRNFVIFVAAATLIGGSSLAIAQDRHDDRGGGGAHADAPHPAPAAAPHAEPAPHGGPGPRDVHGGAPRDVHANAPQAAPVRPAVQAAPNNPGRGNFTRGNNAQPSANPGNNNAQTNANRGNNNANRGGNNAQPNVARGGNAPHRDFSSARNFHQNFSASRHFHAGSYNRPRGYYSHHWSWGETLPSFFWARNYWLNDFVDYGLPPPPPGAVWVRVDDDALLIDADSGEIIEVEYGVFY